jgi:hypothetical protein
MEVAFTSYGLLRVVRMGLNALTPAPRRRAGGRSRRLDRQQIGERLYLSPRTLSTHSRPNSRSAPEDRISHTLNNQVPAF